MIIHDIHMGASMGDPLFRWMAMENPSLKWMMNRGTPIYGTPHTFYLSLFGLKKADIALHGFRSPDVTLSRHGIPWGFSHPPRGKSRFLHLEHHLSTSLKGFIRRLRLFFFSNYVPLTGIYSKEQHR